MTNDKHIPGKRIRNWHRIHRMAGRFPGSLREYARSLVATAAHQSALPSDKERAVTASRWLASKGAKATAPGLAS